MTGSALIRTIVPRHAHVGVVDVAIDDVGDDPVRVPRGPRGVGQLSEPVRRQIRVQGEGFGGVEAPAVEDAPRTVSNPPCSSGRAAGGGPGSQEGRMIWSALIRTIVPEDAVDGLTRAVFEVHHIDATTSLRRTLQTTGTISAERPHNDAVFNSEACSARCGRHCHTHWSDGYGVGRSV